MNISAVSNAHMASVRSAQAAQQPVASKATQSQSVVPTDSDGDHDGSSSGRIDVRA